MGGEIVYVSRSGSTLLASQLASASPELLVLPEFGLLDILVAEGDAAVRGKAPEALLHPFTLDRQFHYLGLDEAAGRRAAECGAGRGIRAVMETLAPTSEETIHRWWW